MPKDSGLMKCHFSTELSPLLPGLPLLIHTYPVKINHLSFMPFSYKCILIHMDLHIGKIPKSLSVLSADGFRPMELPCSNVRREAKTYILTFKTPSIFKRYRVICLFSYTAL